MKILLATLLLICGMTYATDNNYTYYVLVVEWQGSVCEQNTCNQDQGINSTFFNLHGLWPTNPAGTGPSYCTNATFNQSGLTAKVQTELTQYWSGLYASAEEFHAHEWTKHGTCWQDDIGKNPENDFFTKAVELALLADVYGTLNASSVYPSRDYTYTYDDISKPLNAKFVGPQIQCQDYYLSVINICMDLNYNYIKCPSSNNESKFLGSSGSSGTYCPNDGIKYPTFTSSSTKQVTA